MRKACCFEQCFVYGLASKSSMMGLMRVAVRACSVSLVPLRDSGFGTSTRPLDVSVSRVLGNRAFSRRPHVSLKHRKHSVIVSRTFSTG